MDTDAKTDFRVCVVLGKKLKNNRPTCEYMGRIRHLINILKDDPLAFQLVAFCGGGCPVAEARAGLDAFKKQLGELFQKIVFEIPDPIQRDGELMIQNGSGKEIRRIRVFLDQTSSNTIQNVKAIVAYVQNELHQSIGHLSVTLLSSYYHIDRLDTIDCHMPQQSLLRPIRNLVGEDKVILERAPYHYDTVNDPRVQWLAELYRLTDKLTVMRVNIEGIFQLNLDYIIPAVVDIFGDTIVDFGKSLRSAKRLGGGHPAELAVMNATALLRTCHSYFSNLMGHMSFTLEDLQKINCCLDVLIAAIEALKRETDQDEAIPEM